MSQDEPNQSWGEAAEEPIPVPHACGKTSSLVEQWTSWEWAKSPSLRQPRAPNQPPQEGTFESRQRIVEPWMVSLFQYMHVAKSSQYKNEGQEWANGLTNSVTTLNALWLEWEELLFGTNWAVYTPNSIYLWRQHGRFLWRCIECVCGGGTMSNAERATLNKSGFREKLKGNIKVY